VAIDKVIDKKVEAALALASQTLEGGCNGNETYYPPDDAAKRKRREKEVRDRFYSRFASTANRFRDELAKWYGKSELAKWYGKSGAKKVKYAEAFEICEYGRRPSDQEIRKLFPFFPER